MQPIGFDTHSSSLRHPPTVPPPPPCMYCRLIHLCPAVAPSWLRRPRSSLRPHHNPRRPLRSRPSAHSYSAPPSIPPLCRRHPPSCFCPTIIPPSSPQYPTITPLCRCASGSRPDAPRLHQPPRLSSQPFATGFLCLLIPPQSRFHSQLSF